ncbi:glycosyltransferase family 4 protein [Anoxybacillus ayderensis]|uniref:glycosyltransferase family 4 protein n=1 Tax=Anoxybacillus ayderensis TaxID=265546 RepID=UPI002E22F875|nr:glycosyltransferase family 4 protein [Anoxybacillus ayderensis]
MNILVIWRLLTVGGVNAGWRNRAIYFKKHGIATDFLYTKDLGGMHMMEDVANVYVMKKKSDIYDLLRKRYDAIIVVDTSQAYDWLSDVGYRGPIIVEARTPELLKLKRNLQGIEKVTPRQFIVPSFYQKRLLSVLSDERAPITVIYNGLDASFFRLTECDDVPNKKIVAYVGRLDGRKNWRAFLRIASLLQKERDDVECWVIGGQHSVDKEAFETEWKEKQLTSFVKWFPVVPYQQMPNMYAKIRQSGGCLLATTKVESFGNTFIEAMACGVPVVAPRVSAMPEIIVHGKTGYLFREHHTRGAVRAIAEILDDKQQYAHMSEAGRAHVLNRFTIERCAQTYVDLLHNIVGDIHEV